MTIGQQIKEERIKKGFTQEDLADKTGISVRTIQRIENGEVAPRAYSILSIAGALQVELPLSHIADRIEPPEAHHPKNSKVWLPLLHASGLFLLLLPPLLIWFWKGSVIEKVKEQGRDVINFQLSMWIILLPGAVLALFPIPIFIGVFSSAVILINTIKVMNNQSYNYPLTIQFLRP